MVKIVDTLTGGKSPKIIRTVTGEESPVKIIHNPVPMAGKNIRIEDTVTGKVKGPRIKRDY